MVSFTFKAFAVLAIATMLAVVPASAQQSDRMTMKIPFAFSINNKKLPAGTYRVWRTSTTTGAYLIRDVDGKAAAAVVSPARRQAPTVERAKLVFKSYDGEYFLSQIWMPWSDNGAEVPTSRHERHLAQASVQPQIVALVSDRP